MGNDNSASEQIQAPANNVPIQIHAMCGWPLSLGIIGGAVGGALGGAAYGINMAIYKSRMPTGAKIALNVLTGISAFLIWAVIVALIQFGRSQ